MFSFQEKDLVKKVASSFRISVTGEDGTVKKWTIDTKVDLVFLHFLSSLLYILSNCYAHLIETGLLQPFNGSVSPFSAVNAIVIRVPNS